METSHKVSIVIPCWNYGRYLGACIESVLKQTYPIHEIIVVDDESTDDTKEVASKYPVKYIWQKNKGLSGARNTGITEATGEYIMCLDADDLLTPGAIEEHMALIEDDMTIAQCALMEFGERHVSYVPIGATLERILRSNTVFCNAVFSKKLWGLVDGYDESEIMKLGLEDWEFWVRCLAAGARVKTSDFIALRYRVHQNNMTKETTHPNYGKLCQHIYTKNKELYDRYNLKPAGLINN